MKSGPYRRVAALQAIAIAIAVATAMMPASPESAAPRYKHVVLISIDGLHGADLRDPRLAADIPAIRGLMRGGVTYDRALTTAPSDSFPGTVAYLTGAGPTTTGVYYDVTYDRTLGAPGSSAQSPRGTVVDLTEDIDRDPTLLSGGADAASAAIDPGKLPLRCSQTACAPLAPHAYLFANTLYDVLAAHRLLGAFTEKHPAYAIAFGDPAKVEFYAPEIHAKVALEGGRLVDASTASDPHEALHAIEDDERTAEAYDDLKVRATLREIDGRSPDGTRATGIPALIALNLQAVNFAEKALDGGIASDGTPSLRLHRALAYADRAVAEIVGEIERLGLASSTLVFVFAKHGQGPRLGRGTLVAERDVVAPLAQAGIGVAHLTADDVALVWLQHPADAERAAGLLANTGRALRPGRSPGFPASRPSRTPDLILIPPPSVIYVEDPSKPKKGAEHGGFSADDREVALIAWSAAMPATLSGKHFRNRVSTRQIAPTILTALGIDPRELSGVRTERTSVLPGTPW